MSTYDRDPDDPRAPRIHGATPEDFALAQQTKEVCGECQHFEVAEGQRLMEAQKFVETLVREHEWKTHHLCSPLNDLGMCGQHASGSAGDTVKLTGRLHKSCDAFKRGARLVSISRRTTDLK